MSSSRTTTRSHRKDTAGKLHLRNPQDRPKLKHLPTWIVPNIEKYDTGCSLKQGLCDDIHCRRCYDKSFCCKKRSNDWSTENLPLTPRTITKSAGPKYWFNCPNCAHTYKSSPSGIETGKRNRSCPCCAGQQICGDDACIECFNQSFASSPMAKYWSTLNGLVRARDITLSGNAFVWLLCPKCDHNYNICVNDVSKGKRCPYCSGKQLCGVRECEICFQRSYASHPQSQYWSKKNNVQPIEVFKNSNAMYWHYCENCNEDFETTPDRISVLKTWCPKCKRQTEGILRKWLKEYGFIVKIEGKYDWCRSNKGELLPFDCIIEDLMLIIELDGCQHFKQVWNWQSPETRQTIDIYKMKCALEQGYSVIRLLQNDVRFDKNNWKEKLIESIHVYHKPTIIYIDNDCIYDIYRDKWVN